jgi:PhzF family phenazine biosynthesis protein
MLSVAQQVKLSETAFVSKSDTADQRVRFFSPTDEVDLCGHATIAAWSLLRSLGHISNGNYMQQTKAGNLAVEVQDDLVFMEQTPPVFGEGVPVTEVTSMLGITAADFHPSLQPQMVSTGLKDLMVPVKDKQVLARLRPQTKAIEAFSKEHDSYSLHVFALTSGGSLASARNFDPAHGIPEESATGTSNGALLCYLKEKGVLPKQDVYRIEQGEAMHQLSYVYGTFRNGAIWIGGEAKITDHK